MPRAILVVPRRWGSSSVWIALVAITRAVVVVVVHLVSYARNPYAVMGNLSTTKKVFRFVSTIAGYDVVDRIAYELVKGGCDRRKLQKYEVVSVSLFT